MKAKLNVVGIEFFITSKAVTAECHAMPSVNGTFRYNIITHGVARLKDGDKSDVEKAKRIAQKKAIRTAWRAYANYLQLRLDTDLSVLREYKDTAKRIANRIDAEIVKMVNE